MLEFRRVDPHVQSCTHLDLWTLGDDSGALTS